MLENSTMYRVRRGFTLVELLVTMAVSSIIIGATFASYQMVANQYNKNTDIANMHTAGRAIVQMIERDVRMAGFVYLDADAVNTYGAITTPLVITNSGNKCCDSVAITFDKIDEDSKKVERIRITYSTARHVGTKGTRNRLYKQIDILGRGNVVLPTPILGSKDVLADFVEDFQIINLVSDSFLYMGHEGSDTWVHNLTTGKTNQFSSSGVSALAVASDGLLYSGYRGSPNIVIYNPDTGTNIGSIPSTRNSSLTFGDDGLLYAAYEGSDNIIIYDVNTKASTGTLSAARSYAIVYGTDNLLYKGPGSGESGNISIFDTSSGTRIGSISSGEVSALAFGKDGLLYAGYDGGNVIDIYNPKTKLKVGSIADTGRVSALAYGNNNLLYAGYAGSRFVRVYDTVSKVRVTSIDSPRVTALAFGVKNKGKESLITIHLTLRTKNPYSAARNFKKEDYHKGDYELDVTDNYKRDTFTSVVFARNMVL